MTSAASAYTTIPAPKTRVPSGIKGLDKLIQGGLIKGTTTLVSGGTGTGKSIFLLQFIIEGIKHNENGLFITLRKIRRN